MMRITTITCLLAALLFIEGCTGLVSLDLPSSAMADWESDWLTLGRNQKRQHFTHENIAPPLEVVWKRKVKSVIVDHPLAYGDYIFAPTRSGLLYLIDYETGNGVSSGRIGLSMAHAPTIHNNNMYAGITLGENTLLGIDLSNSDKVVDARYPHVSTTPLIEDERIFFGTNNHYFFCANLHSGEEIWSYEARGPIQSSPALHEQYVIFGDDKGWVYALDASSGILLWEAELEGSIFSHPVLDNNNAYIGTVAGKMYALEIESGKTKWEHPMDGAIFGSPALYGNTLYVGNNAHDVIALRTENGERIWRFETGGVVNTVPLPSPDYLYVTSWDKHLYVLNRFSGKLVFKYEMRRPAKSSPIIYRDYLLVHMANHELIAFANEKLVTERSDEE